MSLPSSVNIVEVGPRDGLQNETQTISIDDKFKLIEKLIAAGVSTIEGGSFVSPKWVPQMAGSDELYEKLRGIDSVNLPALTPNLRGYERALECGVKEVAVFAAASESFAQRNTNCSIAESIERFRAIMDAAEKDGVRVRGYVSCVVGCPYEGDISADAVLRVSESLLELGCYEVSLGDTIGVGTTGSVNALLDVLLQSIPASRLAVHFHDTYGQALANIFAALQAGIAVVDSSVAGLGGCPYAKGASGNVATEDVVYMLKGLGIETGIDIGSLAEAGFFISDVLERPSNSKAALALRAKQ